MPCFRSRDLPWPIFLANVMWHLDNNDERCWCWEPCCHKVSPIMITLRLTWHVMMVLPCHTLRDKIYQSEGSINVTWSILTNQRPVFSMTPYCHMAVMSLWSSPVTLAWHHITGHVSLRDRTRPSTRSCCMQIIHCMIETAQNWNHDLVCSLGKPSKSRTTGTLPPKNFSFKNTF